MQKRMAAHSRRAGSTQVTGQGRLADLKKRAGVESKGAGNMDSRVIRWVPKMKASGQIAASEGVYWQAASACASAAL